MNKGAFSFILSAILLFLLGLSLEALAQDSTQQGGRISTGNLRVIPSLTLQEVYDDNIFLGNGSDNAIELKESDWITHLMPGILFNYAMDGRGYVNVGYQGDFAFYNSNDDNDWKNHKGLFGLDYQAPGGLIVGIDNTYLKSSDPYGSGNQYKLGVPQTKRWSDRLKTKAGWNFSDQFKLLGYYNYYKQDYRLESDYSQDFDFSEGGLGFEMKVMPKTWAFARYYYGSLDYYSHPAGMGVTDVNDADFDYHRAEAGVLWDSGGKLTGEVNFGYLWRNNKNTLDPRGNLYDNHDTWVAATSLSYAATSSTTLTLTLSRGVRDTGADSSEYYDDTGIALGLSQKIFTRFTLNVTGAYSKNEFNLPVPNEKEHDNYLASIGLDYRILDWLTAGVGYLYNRKDSNYREDEYRDNQVMFSLRAVY